MLERSNCKPPHLVPSTHLPKQNSSCELIVPLLWQVRTLSAASSSSSRLGHLPLFSASLLRTAMHMLYRLSLRAKRVSAMGAEELF